MEVTVVPDLLPLDGGRIIAFSTNEGANKYSYHFNRITPQQWARCFAGMIVETEQKKNAKGEEERIQHFDVASAGVRMVREIVTKVSGYKVAADRDLMDLPNWRDRLPLGHLQHVASVLQDVVEAKEQVAFIDPDFDVVRLQAAWSSFGGDGMAVFSGLAHFFTPMSVDQQTRLMRAKSQAIVVGGSRSGRTIYPTLNNLYIDMYDELIGRVEGYSLLNGDASGLSSSEAKREMDAWHKVAAITVLTKAPGVDEAA